MLTPQEVSSHAFTKQVMGGYSMTMVDEFLDELTDDYTSLYKENAALKAKLKVLVEKVEDYRTTENSMRATLLTAQKMADSIVHEAEQKRENMIVQSEKDIRENIQRLQDELKDTETRLHQGQKELAAFIEASRALCSRQAEFLDKLPKMPVEKPREVQPLPVKEIEEQVMASFQKEQIPVEEAAHKAAVQAVDEPALEDIVAEHYPEGDPFATTEPSEPTRRINLDEIRFSQSFSDDNNQ